MSVPDLVTSRYFAEGVLTGGGVVPVRVGYEAPIVPLGYSLEETAEALVPEFAMLGEWGRFCRTYLHKLDALGVERIGEELAEIIDRHGGRPLALVDYEDVVRGHRVVFAAWWEEKTGQAVLELTEEGQRLHHSLLPRRVRPKLPKPREDDPRYRSSPPLSWPLTHREVRNWLEERYWQQARSRTNPHSYTLRGWNDEIAFELIVLFIREHGYESIYAGDVYAQYDCGGHFYWTMGDGLPATVVLNRKPLPEGEDGEGKEGRTDELGLFGGEGERGPRGGPR